MRNPFHDLHHQEAGANSHIRLISEGGSSHAQSPEPACIDSIQATQTCTTESQHAVHRSAAACSTALPRETSICSLAAEHAGELDREAIPGVLRHRLELLGSPLTCTARIGVREPGRVWRIDDQGRAYSLRRHRARILVYLEL